MIRLSGYSTIEEIYSGKSTIIYRAVEEKTGKKVVLKLLKKDFPTNQEIENFEYEFNISKELLDIEGVLKNYDIVSFMNTKIIIMEDFGGISLDKVFKEKKLDLKLFLIIAIKIVSTLGEIHKKHIIHKDIKPQNILLNPDTKEVKIIDFSISTKLSKEQQEIKNPENLEGTLSYISPEQTGRMNRSIDYRSDFYSLGITFYELLTQTPAFIVNSAMELVHSQIAKMPTPPDEINNDIPPVLSKMIMKLMSKNAEDRYQSSYGLKLDLEKCYNSLIEKGVIESFELGENDLSERFQIPEKLYGREKEIQYLLDVFNNTTDGKKEIIFVKGLSGIGKSALINELHKPIVKQKGFFISGKYDQFRENIPYYAVIFAFQELVKQLISQNKDVLNQWKKEILNIVGNNGKVLTDIIPELELIIGKQHDMQILAPGESQNRFNFVLQNFIKLFAKEKHPLVLFLDDLQWIDNASLNLLKVLLRDEELKYFLFIGSYRENEVNEKSLLTVMLENIRKEDFSWQELRLEELKLNDISLLLLDTFRSPVKKTEQLAEVVFNKTKGNPFFVGEFIKRLYNDNLIEFKNKWEWDIDKISSANITDNVIQLMAEKIKKLDSEALSILKLASCIGVKFDLNLISAILKKPVYEIVLSLLDSCLNEGMVVKSGNDIKFVHDRVREATYSLIEKEEKQKLHYKIGFLLLENSKDENSEDKIFNITDQLDKAKEILTQEEKNTLIKLNLEAGLKAKGSVAFDVSLKLFNEAIGLLQEDCWEKEYDLTIQIYTEKAQAEFLVANYENGIKISDYILLKAKNLKEKIKIYQLKIDYFTEHHRVTEALKIGNEALKLFKIKLPIKGNPILLIKELAIAKRLIGKKKIEDLVDLPQMNNEEKFILADLLLHLIAPAYIGSPKLFPIIVLKLTNISLKYGLSVFSPYCFASYAVILSAGLKDFENGYKFGLLSLKLLERLNSKPLLPKIYFLYGVGLNHWKNHIKEGISYLKDGYSLALEMGDLVYTGYNMNHYLAELIFTGQNLLEVSKQFKDLRSLQQKLKHLSGIHVFNIFEQFCLNLIGSSKDRLSFEGKYIENEMDFVNSLKENLSAYGFYKVLKLIIYYLFNEVELAYHVCLEIKKAEGGFFGMMFVQFYYFFYGLTLKEYCLINENQSIINKNLRTLKNIIKKYRIWAKTSPDNYMAPYLLLRAEFYNISNRQEKSIKLYDRAILVAKENSFSNIEAIANECAVKFYVSKGMNKIAESYFIEAKYCYSKWGANEKVKDLDRRYGFLMAVYRNREEIINFSSTIAPSMKPVNKIFHPTETSTSSTLLDFATVMKATQTISSEIEMEKLLAKMLKIVIENAGAEKGFFILSKNDDLFIECESYANKDDYIVLKSIPLDKQDKLSSSIVRFAVKTKENLVLGDATKEGAFVLDNYVLQAKPKSVLCFPIISQGKSLGAIYLENNFVTYAFTPHRVEILKLLSTQAAISIENANLIDGMKERERLKQEMVIAQRIQASLLPRIPQSKELEMSAIMKPAEEVGGDYYDILKDKEDKIWFAIGDVSGYGVTPGLILMMAETALTTKVKNSEKITPSEALILINKILSENVRERLRENHFMTMTLFKYEGDGKFLYAGAHLDIMIYRAKTGKIELLKTDGIFLAILPDISKIVKQFEFTLEKDDIMVIYTDGVTSTRFPENREVLFGMKNFCDVVEKNSKKNAEEIRNAILNATLDFCKNKLDDDITIVVVKKK